MLVNYLASRMNAIIGIGRAILISSCIIIPAIGRTADAGRAGSTVAQTQGRGSGGGRSGGRCCGSGRSRRSRRHSRSSCYRQTLNRTPELPFADTGISGAQIRVIIFHRGRKTVSFIVFAGIKRAVHYNRGILTRGKDRICPLKLASPSSSQGNDDVGYGYSVSGPALSIQNHGIRQYGDTPVCWNDL